MNIKFYKHKTRETGNDYCKGEEILKSVWENICNAQLVRETSYIEEKGKGWKL